MPKFTFKSNSAEIRALFLNKLQETFYRNPDSFRTEFSPTLYGNYGFRRLFIAKEIESEALHDEEKIALFVRAYDELPAQVITRIKMAAFIKIFFISDASVENLQYDQVIYNKLLTESAIHNLVNQVAPQTFFEDPSSLNEEKIADTEKIYPCIFEEKQPEQHHLQSNANYFSLSFFQLPPPVVSLNDKKGESEGNRFIRNDML